MPNTVEESAIQDQFNRDPSPEIVEEQFTTAPPASSSLEQNPFISTRAKSPEIHQQDQIIPIQTPLISPQKQRKRVASPIATSISTIPSKVARTAEPEETNSNGLLKFYFIDAYEDIYKHPGL